MAKEKCPCETDANACCACVSMHCDECHKPNQSKFVQGRFCSNCGRPLKAELTRLYVPKSEVDKLKIEIEALKIANEKMYAANKEHEAEIDRLEGALKAEERHNQLTMEIAQKAIENAKDEANKDLQAEIADKDKAIKNALEIISIGEKQILEVGASWIKEFAKFLIDNSTEGLIAISDLPDLVKEMTEGKAHEMQSTDQP